MVRCNSGRVLFQDVMRGIVHLKSCPKGREFDCDEDLFLHSAFSGSAQFATLRTRFKTTNNPLVISLFVCAKQRLLWASDVGVGRPSPLDDTFRTAASSVGVLSKLEFIRGFGTLISKKKYLMDEPLSAALIPQFDVCCVSVFLLTQAHITWSTWTLVHLLSQ